MKNDVEVGMRPDDADALTISAAVLARFAPDREELLAALFRILQAHTPFSYLRQASAERIADCIRQFFQLMEGRRQEVAVTLLPTDEEGKFLLVSNCPDASFLLDSLQNYLIGKNLRHQVVSHPLLAVRRQGRKIIAIGQINDLGGEGRRESLIVLVVEGIAGEERDEITRGAAAILGAAVGVQRDSHALGQRLKELAQKEEMSPRQDFWQWLRKGNFLPFSYRTLAVRKDGSGALAVCEEQGSALGLVAADGETCAAGERSLTTFPSAFQARIDRSSALLVDETGQTSPLHRAEPLVYLGFRESMPGGWREHAFLGLFSRQSIDEPACNVPALRLRIENALAALGIPRDCHDYRKTIEIFNTFPKVELFFLAAGELVEIVPFFYPPASAWRGQGGAESQSGGTRSDPADRYAEGFS